MIDHEQVKTRSRRFADTECKGYSDHYYRLAHAIADEDEVVAFIAEMPVIQPNLFLASVQFLTGPESMPTSGADLKAFLQDRREDVSQLMHSRRTQTNEVGRCASLLPALPRGDLALLEVGASAGLCLLLDQFFYDYGDVQLGRASSPVHLRCTTKGSPPLPLSMPPIAWRAGLDLRPIDVNDEDDARWLLSCVWPEHGERRERLAAAIELARCNAVSVHRGDLLSDLSALISEVPRDARLVVFHSAVLAYVDTEGRQAFAESLAEESKSREIVWISNEGAGAVPEISALAPPIDRQHFLLGRTHFENGRRSDELLAVAQAHGTDLDWLGSHNVMSPE